MTDSTSLPATAQAPSLGLVARFIGIITSPRATFEDVVKSPRPVGILLLVGLVLAVSVGAPQFTDKGRQAALDLQVRQVEKFTGQTVTDQVYDAMEKRSHYNGVIAMVSTFIFLPIGLMIGSAIYWGIFNGLLAGTATFKQVMGVVAHSSVISAVGAALGAPIQYMQGTASTTGPFNLGALMPFLPEGGFLANFFGSVGVFTIWGVIVTAIGLSVLYRRKSRNIAITLMAIYAVFVAAIAAFTSR